MDNDKAADTLALSPPRRIPAPWPRPAWLVAAALILAVVGFVDSITGPELSFAFCYLVPVLLATWFVGRRAGYVIAVAGAVVWLVAELNGAAAYSRTAIAYWNAGTRLAFFLLAAALVARFKELRDGLEATVEARTATLRRLAAQLSEAEDAERRKIAHDMHDGFSQMLSVLKLNLAAASQASAAPEAADRLREAITTVDELIHRARTLTFDLHPSMLDTLGLVPTLHKYATDFGRQTGLEVTISEVGPRRPLPPVLSNYLFRSIKELLGNTAKHGSAKQVVTAVHWDLQNVRVVVDDDGVGFDPAKLTDAEAATKGLGLAGIRERLISLGGGFRIESSVGGGTRVVLDVPLPSEEPAS